MLSTHIGRTPAPWRTRARSAQSRRHDLCDDSPAIWALRCTDVSDLSSASNEGKLTKIRVRLAGVNCGTAQKGASVNSVFHHSREFAGQPAAAPHHRRTAQNPTTGTTIH